MSDDDASTGENHPAHLSKGSGRIVEMRESREADRLVENLIPERHVVDIRLQNHISRGERLSACLADHLEGQVEGADPALFSDQPPQVGDQDAGTGADVQNLRSGKHTEFVNESKKTLTNRCRIAVLFPVTGPAVKECGLGCDVCLPLC